MRHDQPVRSTDAHRVPRSRDAVAADRLRAPAFPHELVVHERTTPEEVAERIAGADVVITNKVPLRREPRAARDGSG